mgnify:FL=1
MEILDGAVAAGATAGRVAERMGISLRTLQRWRRQFAACDGGGVDGHGRDGGDRRKGSARHVPHRLSEQERQEILAVCNQPQYASLPPAQIVPDLADQGRYLASESSFYRVLHAHQQVQRRGRARPPQAPRPVPRRRADGPNQLWSWDITYLPTGVRGVWLYLYLVVDVWSRKIVAWDVHDREDAELAAALISRACLRERISKRRQRQLILHADNGGAMRSATLETRLEELGVLRSFSRPRVSNDNPFSEALFRTAKYRPDYPSRPFASQEEACQWAATFVEWYVHEHRHSGIKFVTPQQRHSGQAGAISQQRTLIYERAREHHPRRWSRSVRCWKQPAVVWINEPTDDTSEQHALLFRQAA